MTTRRSFANFILVLLIVVGWLFMGALIAMGGTLDVAVVWCVGTAALVGLYLYWARRFGCWNYLWDF